jgi:hypothetical protein
VLEVVLRIDKTAAIIMIIKIIKIKRRKRRMITTLLILMQIQPNQSLIYGSNILLWHGAK